MSDPDLTLREKLAESLDNNSVEISAEEYGIGMFTSQSPEELAAALLPIVEEHAREAERLLAADILMRVLDPQSTYEERLDAVLARLNDSRRVAEDVPRAVESEPVEPAHIPFHNLRYHKCDDHLWLEVSIDGAPWAKVPGLYGPRPDSEPACPTPFNGEVSSGRDGWTPLPAPESEWEDPEPNRCVAKHDGKGSCLRRFAAPVGGTVYDPRTRAQYDAEQENR